MNILFITKLLPHRLDGGGKVRTFRILQILSKRHKIHLVTFVDSKSYLVYARYLKTFCANISIFVKPLMNNKNYLTIVNYIYSLFRAIPFTVYKYHSKKMELYIKEKLTNQSYDMLFIDHINMAQYIPADFKGEVVCNEHDISSLAFKKYHELENNLFLKFIYWLESKKLASFEKFWIPKFDHIYSISKLDRKLLIQIGAKKENVTYIPTPFKTHYCYNPNLQSSNVTFIGLLSWLPNEIGLSWFIKQVLPIVILKIPEIKFLVVGKNGDNILHKYKKKECGKNIIYCGYIKNITLIYKQSSVFVVPILVGSGIRIKLLEALSHGIPVVSTSFGAEGIDFKNKDTILIEDQPEKFAEAIIRIINNKDLAMKLSKKGFNVIKTDYNFKLVNQIFRKIL